jgi:hypothetical protein
MSTNVPTTTWIDPNNEVDFTSGTQITIVDTVGVTLVDTAGVTVVDTGVTATYMPATGWTEDDSE